MNNIRYYQVESNVADRQYTTIESDLANKVTGKELDIFDVDSALQAVVATTTNSRPLSDFLACYDEWFLVSERALEALNACHVCPSVRWIETTVCTRRRKVLATYWLAYGAKAIDVWNYNLSDCYWHDPAVPGDARLPGMLLKGVLGTSGIPVGVDLFWATHRTWIASSHLREVVITSKLSGFCFSELGVG